MDKCYLIRRGNMYDVYINNKKVGSGQWWYKETAYIVYRQEGFDVEILDE